MSTSRSSLILFLSLAVTFLFSGQVNAQLHLAAGWYCGAADSFFDSDGERRDWEGFKETQGMFFAQAKYPFATLNAGSRQIEVTGLARVSVDRIKQKYDVDKVSDRSGSGLGVITLGVAGKTAINPNLDFRLGFDAFLDVASDPDFESGDLAITDGSHAVGINGGIKYHKDNFYGGLKLGHVNRTEENFRSTNFVSISGGAQVWSNDKIAVTIGAGLNYHADTDNGGNLYGVSPIIKTNFIDHDLSLKIGNGCTEDYVPVGLYQFGGESSRDINALGITVSKTF